MTTKNIQVAETLQLRMSRERAGIDELKAPVVGERLTLTVVEAAQILGIGRGLAYQLARSGQLPVIKFGRRLVIPVVALQRMLEEAGGSRDATWKRTEGNKSREECVFR